MTTRRPHRSKPANRHGNAGKGRPQADPARVAAYEVLFAVRNDDAYTNLVLPQVLRKYRLTGRDAAFVTELASGTIRLRGRYDPIIDACLAKPRLEAKVRDVLRLGAHQLLGMRVPDHAAISTTVDLARARIGPGPTGLVNAVLRKIAAKSSEEWLGQLCPLAGTEPDPARLEVAHSHPRWVVQALAEALAATAADAQQEEVDRLLAANNEAPEVTLVARPGRAEVDELPGTRTRWSPYGVVMTDGGDPGGIPAVAQRRAGVQDEGSQLVALALADAPLEGPDRRWLDLCAGPGGKAALLASLAAQRGARLVANESQPHRAELVRGVLQVERVEEWTAHSGVEDVVVADGRDGPWQPGSFDRVLLDAPCSGLGALRRRPEARWRRTPADLADLLTLQRELLDAAIDAARPGGAIVYATCSPVLAETAGQITDLLARRDDVALEPIPTDIEDSAGVPSGTVQLWPHRHRTDAMYYALLRRLG